MIRSPGLAGRLLQAQVVIVGIGVVCLAATAAVVAPPVFSEHLTMAGETDPVVQEHAREAFRWAFAVSMTVAGIASLTAAVLLSWLLARRVGRPMEELAAAAESVAAGDYGVRLPDDAMGRELTTLVATFSSMADRLSDTEAARDRVMSDLAHEMRTPVATLEAQVDALEDGVLAPDAESFDSMRAQLGRLRRLAHDLSEVVRIQEGGPGMTLAPVRLDAVIGEAVAGARARFVARDVALGLVDEADAGVVVAVDHDRIQQVFGNLLDNALRHTPPGGAVTVRTRSTASTVTVEVADTGEGIDQTDIDRVFDRLHRGDSARTRSRGEGSGLGLTIARAIVIAHGGSLTAASAGPGQGAVFTVVMQQCPQADRSVRGPPAGPFSS
ncbi:MAG: HAMP domain-containing sensor histidine kinase [Actinomycetota bacterium]|nr:HAMP domain-containing sensor histidine kinase [Actinomycetota bacterium]